MDTSAITNLVTDLLVRYSFQVLAALAIFAAGLLVARWVGAAVTRSLSRTQLELHLQRLLVRAVKLLVVLFTFVLALDKFGVQVTALVAGISVAGLAGGLALQGVLANFAAGISIMFARYFRIGDYIEIGSVKGQVTSIDLSMTVLRTLEDARVVVPNRRIVGEVIYNYSAERRVTMHVEVGYNEDLGRALAAVRAVLGENPRVLKEPAPEVGIVNLGDSGIQIALRPWCKAEDFWLVQYEVYRAILERFRQEKIATSVPTREVHLITQ